jgi:hypothetical protein
VAVFEAAALLFDPAGQRKLDCIAEFLLRIFGIVLQREADGAAVSTDKRPFLGQHNPKGVPSPLFGLSESFFEPTQQPVVELAVPIAVLEFDSYYFAGGATIAIGNQSTGEVAVRDDFHLLKIFPIPDRHGGQCVDAMMVVFDVFPEDKSANRFGFACGQTD